MAAAAHTAAPPRLTTPAERPDGGTAMGRAERPIDAGAGPLARFALDLRSLRDGSGRPTYRELARRSGYSATALSMAASGHRLPSLDVTIAYVTACGADPGAWRTRWHALASQPLQARSEGVWS